MKKYIPSIIMFGISCALAITIGVLSDISNQHSGLCWALGIVAFSLLVPTMISAMETDLKHY